MKKSDNTFGRAVWPWLMALFALLPGLPAHAQLTIDECQQLARENYPLIRRYDLIRQSSALTVDNIGKTFLPQVNAYGQATLQSETAALPETLKSVLQQMGYESKGLARYQYKVGFDASQLIYDGGRTKAAKELATLQAETDSREVETQLYQLRQQVNALFFGILAIDEQLTLNDDTQTLLKDNQRKLETLVAHGTAWQANVDAVRAELLRTQQQQTLLLSQRRSAATLLSIYIGRDVTPQLCKPAAAEPAYGDVDRPELLLLDARARLLEAKRRQLDTQLKPTLSAFAQGYFGYPGYNMFDDMMGRSPSLNGLVGLRVSWNIGSLYTRKNDKAQIDVALGELTNAREVFLFNNRLQSAEEREAIDRFRKVMAQDEEIIQLRVNVRKSAEARLNHGVIDVNDLLQEITRECSARSERSVHEIEMLKHIYELRTVLNQ